MAKSIKPWNQKFEKYLSGMPPTVFNSKTLKEFFDDLKSKHLIPSKLNLENFIANLTISKMIPITKIKYVGNAYSGRAEIIRYICNSPSPFSIALSLRSKSYLSHNSALFLNGLIDKIPKKLCVNKEQSKKKANSNTLTQAGIDRAFKNYARESQYIWRWKRYNFILLNGKHTGDYGVIDINIQTGEKVRTTNLERTLVDIVVRPNYSGGVKGLVEIYRHAIGKVSARQIIKTLNKLSYTYPYHQSIGFLMERAGFDKQEFDQLRELGINYDFYLDYSIKNKEYDTKWKLYYPKGL